MVTDRRRALRFDYRDGFLPPAARVRPGHDVIVVNLSSSGMLVEGTCRLHPGCLVESRLFFDRGPLQIDGEVVRAFVSAVDRVGLRYRAGIAFALPIPVTAPPDLLVGYQLPTTVRGDPGTSGSGYPHDDEIIAEPRSILAGDANLEWNTLALDLDRGEPLLPGDTRRR
jgi:hypothetical protein